jgi:hypothetical protein
MRWLLGIMLFALSCASASTTPMDAGPDLFAGGTCNPQTLFSSCSAQCGMPICVVQSATCSAANEWVCDCSKTGPCGPDMRLSD